MQLFFSIWLSFVLLDAWIWLSFGTKVYQLDLHCMAVWVPVKLWLCVLDTAGRRRIVISPTAVTPTSASKSELLSSPHFHTPPPHMWHATRPAECLDQLDSWWVQKFCNRMCVALCASLRMVWWNYSRLVKWMRGPSSEYTCTEHTVGFILPE